MEALIRARIEKIRLKEIANIETKRKEALAKLKIEYKIADQVKTSFGIIGLISLFLLFGSILLNDFAKLMNSIHQNFLNYKYQRKYRERKEQSKEINAPIQIELDRNYLYDLEEKLEKTYYKLIKAVAFNKKNYP